MATRALHLAAGRDDRCGSRRRGGRRRQQGRRAQRAGRWHPRHQARGVGRSLMRHLRLSALAVGLVVLGAALLSPLRERFFGRTRLRFPYLARPIAAASYAALASKPGWAKSEVRVAPDITLRGLLRRPSSNSAPWVLFYPGNDESQLERGHAFLTALAGDRDWGLAVYAYRGYDASDGKPG